MDLIVSHIAIGVAGFLGGWLTCRRVILRALRQWRDTARWTAGGRRDGSE